MIFKDRRSSVQQQSTLIINTKQDSAIENECTIPSDEWDEENQLTKTIKIFEVNKHKRDINQTPKFYKPLEKRLSDDSVTDIPPTSLSEDENIDKKVNCNKNTYKELTLCSNSTITLKSPSKQNSASSNNTITSKPVRPYTREQEVQTINNSTREQPFNLNINTQRQHNFPIPFTHPIPVPVYYAIPYYFPRSQATTQRVNLSTSTRNTSKQTPKLNVTHGIGINIHNPINNNKSTLKTEYEIPRDDSSYISKLKENSKNSVYDKVDNNTNNEISCESKKILKEDNNKLSTPNEVKRASTPGVLLTIDMDTTSTLAEMFKKKKWKLADKIKKEDKKEDKNKVKEPRTKEKGENISTKRIREKILAKRHEMMQSSNHPIDKSNIITRRSSVTTKEPSEELIRRLIKGERVKVSKKEMYELTKKNYDLLPEVKLKKEMQEKQQQHKERIEQIRRLERVFPFVICIETYKASKS